jgi:type VI secretion system secreted protein VgrG
MTSHGSVPAHAHGTNGSGAPEARGTRRLQAHLRSADALDITEFAIHERMSDLFEVKLTVLSNDPHLDFDEIVGHPAAFSIHGSSITTATARYFSGIASNMEQVAATPRGASTYELTLVPVLWLLTQRRNHRMFQQLSELEIVKKLLGEWGIEPRLEISSVHKTRKYRVQYAESDYRFFCRMLEDAGISFYFEQEGTETRLVLSDAPQIREPHQPALRFHENTTHTRDLEHATKLRIGQKVRPGRYTIGDHDTRLSPNLPLTASAKLADGGVEDRLERFHYAPGAFHFGSDKGESTPSADDHGKARTDVDEGERVAKKRLQAKRADARVITFETNATDIGPGVIVHIVDHPRAEVASKKGLLIVASTWSGKSTESWTRTLEARFADAPFVPKLVTPRPKVSGVECATVVGPDGDEIHTDEFGRVRVHFHWDRESQMNQRSSCWIPVSQAWGGAGYGGSNLPRIGQEVIVDFLGGNPDKPVITGRLYTKFQGTPYKLPDNKTQSGWKSNSTHKTGGYNEVMFEDAAGIELLRIQAEKDLHKLVKNDENVTIGHDREKLVKNDDRHTVGHNRTKLVQNDEDVTIGNDRTKLVKNDDNLTVGNDRTKLVQMSSREVVGQNRTRSVGVNENVSIGSNHTLNVGTDQSVSIGSNHSTSVGADHSTSVGGSQSTNVAASQSTRVGGAQTTRVGLMSAETIGLVKALTVGGAYEVTVGGMMQTNVMMTATESVGMNKTITVGKELTIVCGKSKAVLDQAGNIAFTGEKIALSTSKGASIVLDGANIAIEGDFIVVKGKKGTMVETEGGDAILQASGGDVLIHGGPKVLINS